jgi:hypothetical protein
LSGNNDEFIIDIESTLVCRALQAVYNAGKARDIFYFRNGDALLFGLTCAQVLYAYTVVYLGSQMMGGMN